MEITLKSKPHVSFEFEIEKIVGVSNDGRYQVQWAPAWVSKFHLVGCEHLIREFLQEQSEKVINPDPEIQHEISEEVSGLLEENCNEKYFEGTKDKDELLPFEINIKVEDTEMEVPEEPSDSNAVVCTSTITLIAKPEDKLAENSDRFQSSQARSTNQMSSNFIQAHTQFQGSSMLDANSAPLLQTDTESVFECNICGVEFSCENMLNVHLKTHKSEGYPCHSDNQCYSCDQCDSSFVKKSFFISHICSSDIKKPYNCPHCDFKFKQKHYFNQHLLTHEHEKPFSCELCGKSFAQKYALKTHMRTHTGDKPFSCQLCGKAYSDKSNCNRHMRSCSIKQKRHKDRL